MQLGQLLSQGGWAMWPIYLCSFVALFFFWERFFFFWRVRARALIWLEPVLQKLRQGEFQVAVSFCEQVNHPVGRVIAAAIRMHQRRPDRTAAEAERVGLAELEAHERYLTVLSFIAQVAPLLGLLGTVLGMVKMFYGLQQAGLTNVDAAALSTGIWQALLTTAAGLIVAAPTLAAYMYLTARVDRLRHQLRDAVERLLSTLPAPNQATASEREDV